jgi:hypothetical protein
MSVSSQAADVPRANFADFKTSVEFASPITTICGTRRSGVSGVSALSHRIENVRERASERASAPLIRIDRFNSLTNILLVDRVFCAHDGDESEAQGHKEGVELHDSMNLRFVLVSRTAS